MSIRRQTHTVHRSVAIGLSSMVLLGACAATGSDDEADQNASAAPPSESPSATEAAPEPAISGDGTWEVGSDVQPGVYVGDGGNECQYQRLGDLDGDFPDVIVRGLLDRPVVEIMDGDGGFRTEGCGSWTALEDYAGSPSGEMAGDGIWLVGQDIEPGTYQAEGGDWCIWQRLSAFAPELDSVIEGGSDKRATVAPDDLAFYTEGCGAWTKIG